MKLYFLPLYSISALIISRPEVLFEALEKKFINLNFNDHPGNTENFWFPTTRKDAHKKLDEFLKERIKLFGDYEDAVSERSNTMFHSALSPIINIGLITPEELI